MREYVTFAYEGSGRTITVSPAKAHEVATAHEVVVFAGWDAYEAFCESHGHEIAASQAEPEPVEDPAEQAVDPGPAADPEETGASDPDGWPAGYSSTQKRGWVTVYGPDGEVGKTRSAEAALQIAIDHQNATSDDQATED